MTRLITRILAASVALVAALLLNPGAAPAATLRLSGEVWSAAGTNWCEFNLCTDDMHSKGVTKDLYVQTHGATYSCFAQGVDRIGGVHAAYDCPGNGWSRYTFTYGLTNIRVCQNGNPGVCGGWYY
jgi:hypothetical protein